MGLLLPAAVSGLWRRLRTNWPLACTGHGVSMCTHTHTEQGGLQLVCRLRSVTKREVINALPLPKTAPHGTASFEAEELFEAEGR